MASYNLFLASVTTTWTTTGETPLQILGREVVEPASPATTTNVKSPASAGAKVEATFALPAELSAELAEGAKVTAATVHFSIKGSAASKQVKLQSVSPAETLEPVLTTGQAWYTLALSKAHAEELSKAKLEELVVIIERLLGAPIAYELYVSLETKAAEGGTVQLAGTAKIAIAGEGAAAMKAAAAGTASMRFADSGAVAMTAQAAGTTQVRLAATSTVGVKGQIKAAGNCAITIGAKGEVRTTSKLAGATQVRIVDTAAVAVLARLTGSTPIRLASSGRATQRSTLAGVSRIIFVATGTAKEGGSEPKPELWTASSNAPALPATAGNRSGQPATGGNRAAQPSSIGSRR